ncbi:TetR/AcrR family transcriptional regulator [Actinoplanes sp. NBC_00393]|uniref:TetR/AcrR family transcriptional regulator n=1 Tax=Actinoplanes sp. NBC_00393 TaxID=2975953 RepID=UPI002E1CE699
MTVPPAVNAPGSRPGRGPAARAADRGPARFRAPEPPRPRDDRARETILRRAADLASQDGLDGLTIGRLATDLGLSKSGLFGYFGSKEELQLATIRTATTVFLDEVVEPALAAEPGRDRLTRLLENWLSYSERRVFAGGCFFFFSVNAEFDARPGRVRDTLTTAGKGLDPAAGPDRRGGPRPRRARRRRGRRAAGVRAGRVPAGGQRHVTAPGRRRRVPPGPHGCRQPLGRRLPIGQMRHGSRCAG